MQDSAYQRLNDLEQEIAMRLIRVCQDMTKSDFAALVRQVALNRLKWEVGSDSYERTLNAVRAVEEG